MFTESHIHTVVRVLLNWSHLGDLTMGRMVIRSALVNVRSYEIEAGQLSRLACHRCRSSLDLHQPDPNQPGQFLGICPDCGRWYRVESRTEDSKALVVVLPEIEEIQAGRSGPADRSGVDGSAG